MVPVLWSPACITNSGRFTEPHRNSVTKLKQLSLFPCEHATPLTNDLPVALSLSRSLALALSVPLSPTLSLSLSRSLVLSRSLALSLSRSLALALSRSLALSLSRSLALSLSRSRSSSRPLAHVAKNDARPRRLRISSKVDMSSTSSTSATTGVTRGRTKQRHRDARDMAIAKRHSALEGRAPLSSLPGQVRGASVARPGCFVPGSSQSMRQSRICFLTWQTWQAIPSLTSAFTERIREATCKMLGQ